MHTLHRNRCLWSPKEEKNGIACLGAIVTSGCEPSDSCWEPASGSFARCKCSWSGSQLCSLTVGLLYEFAYGTYAVMDCKGFKKLRVTLFDSYITKLFLIWFQCFILSLTWFWIFLKLLSYYNFTYLFSFPEIPRILKLKLLTEM